MAWNDKIELGQWVETVTHGEPIRTLSWTTVFANKKSIRQSEFYESRNVGLKPELMYEVHTHEFSNHEEVRIGGSTGKIYDIIRVYEKDDITELILSGPTGRAV